MSTVMEEETKRWTAKRKVHLLYPINEAVFSKHLSLIKF